MANMPGPEALQKRSPSYMGNGSGLSISTSSPVAAVPTSVHGGQVWASAYVDETAGVRFLLMNQQTPPVRRMIRQIPMLKPLPKGNVYPRSTSAWHLFTYINRLDSELKPSSDPISDPNRSPQT